MEQTVFRNVGIQNSDAGQLPRRKHTTFRTGRKFEINNNIQARSLHPHEANREKSVSFIETVNS